MDMRKHLPKTDPRRASSDKERVCPVCGRRYRLMSESTVMAPNRTMTKNVLWVLGWSECGGDSPCCVPLLSSTLASNR
jgi:hypothetical protein